MAVKRYNVQDGGGVRTGGPYLDKVQAKAANDDRKARGDSSSADTAPYAGMQLDTAEGIFMNRPVMAARSISDYDDAIESTEVVNN